MRPIALLCLVPLFACSPEAAPNGPASSGSPTAAVSEPTSKDEPPVAEERVLAETLSSIEQLTALLATVHDAASAASARPQVATLATAIRTTQAQADSIAFLPKAQQDALQVKFESRLKAANQGLVEQLGRVATLLPELPSQLRGK